MLWLMEEECRIAALEKIRIISGLFVDNAGPDRLGGNVLGERLVAALREGWRWL